MNKLPHITEVTSETFHGVVLERSQQVPVLVDYWAEWCGPCQMQLPVLMKLVEEHAGGFELAKINTDEQQGLAREHGIRSLPTMRLYKDGEIAEEILGAQTESTLRTLLDRYIVRESDGVREQAAGLRAEGKTDEAQALLLQSLQADPGNHRLVTDYAELCIKQGQLETAREMLDGLSADVREEPESLRLKALLEFASVTENAPPIEALESAVSNDPEDMESRYLLASRYVLAGQFEQALEMFMEILKNDREFRDDAGRKGMLTVFNLLGNEGELVSSYRRSLFNAIT